MTNGRWAGVALILLGCAETAGAPAPDVPDAGSPEVSAPQCHEARRMADGQCCSEGTVPVGEECRAVGLAECATGVGTADLECAPHWCAQWFDAQGAECTPGESGCHLQPRPCKGSEAGCPVGTWPDPMAGSQCVPAGLDSPTEIGTSWSGSAVPDDACEDVHSEECAAATAGLAGGCEPGWWMPAPGDTCVPAGPITAPIEGTPRWCWDGPIPTEACLPGTCAFHGRACTASEAAAGAGCPAGEWPGEDGACAPVLGDGCPAGFDTVPPRADGELPGCAPSEDDCTAPVADDGPVAHVDAGAEPGGDGTQAAPFASLAAAVAAVPDGATILLEAGTYDAGLELSRPVRIAGGCAHGAVLETDADAGLLITGQNVRVEGVTIRAAKTGIEILEGGWIDLRRVLVSGPSTFAIWLHGEGATALVSHSVLEGGDPASEEQPRVIRGQIGTLVGLHAVRLLRPTSIGLSCGGAESRLVGTAVVSASARAWDQKPDLGMGAVAVEDGMLELIGARLSRQLSLGATANVGGDLRLVGTDISHTAMTPLGGAGQAAAAAGAKVELVGCLLRDSHEAGLMAILGGLVRAEDVVVQDTHVREIDGDGGFGLVAQQGAFELRGVRVERSVSLGISIEENSSLSGVGVRVRSVDLDPLGGLIGLGIRVNPGATARLFGVHVEDVATDGIYSAGKDVLVVGLHADRPRVAPVEISERAVRAQAGSTIAIHHSRIVDQRRRGVQASGPGTHLSLHDVLIDGVEGSTEPQVDGSGVRAHGGARITARRLRIQNVKQLAGIVLGEDGVFEGREVSIADTSGPHLKGGTCVAGLETGWSISLEASHLSRCTGVGVMADGAGYFAATGLRVDEVTTWPAAGDEHGTGISITRNAGATLAGVAIADVEGYGAIVVGAPDYLFAGVDVQRSGRPGIYANNSPGAILDSRVVEATGVGVAVDAGLALLDGLVTAGTRPMTIDTGSLGEQTLGDGIVLVNGAVTARRIVSWGNARAGLLNLEAITDLESAGLWNNLYGMVDAQGRLTARDVFEHANTFDSDGAELAAPPPPQLIEL